MPDICVLVPWDITFAIGLFLSSHPSFGLVVPSKSASESIFKKKGVG